MQASETERVEALHRLGVLDSGPDRRFDDVVRLARRLFEVPTALVTLVDRTRTVHKAGDPGGVLPREQTFCSTTVAEDRTLVVPDATLDPRFAGLPRVAGEEHVRFYAGQPLRAPGGHRVGVLCLVDVRPREFGPEQQALLRDLAHWVEAQMAVELELERAAQIQAGLLPREAPLVPGYGVAGACVAAGIGGDFFDWSPTPAGLTLSIVDVLGTGPAASIMAASVRAVLRVASRQAGVAGALEEAGAVLHTDLHATGFLATSFHAHLDRATGDVTYADAGHGLTLVVHPDGTSTRLAASGLPLGVLPTPVTAERTVHLDPGDLLVTFSDGLVERFTNSADCLPAVHDALRGAASAQAAVDAVLALAAQGRAGAADVTVLAVRRDDAGV
ncbi:PP2C family protein-serine/threonine phosphatase [Cellulomonas cellasea]|uniref:PPM-type phosphatase domain-containing protein n=1 Tax=Cellulomonas cellasea TaxID=43670 RepID=A0A4Y3KWV8_9CELL|nr:SpoIIE family protein phosphatase [Cellulomonas cellasea]GEA87924.1 hypothetical protein CCE01nite_18730 [Cellulomonas cellasea]